MSENSKRRRRRSGQAPKSEIRVNTYAVLSACIERGIEAGWHRAHKHGTPAPHVVRSEIESAIMTEISEFFRFDD
jgi:hypothetical protein